MTTQNELMTLSSPPLLSGFIWQYYKRRESIWWLMLNLAGIVLGSFGLVYFATMIEEVANMAASQTLPTMRDVQHLMFMVGAMGILLIIASVASNLGWRNGRVPLEMSMKAELFRRVQHHSHQYFLQNPSGTVAQKVNDVPWHTVLLLDAVHWWVIPPTSLLLFSTYFLWQAHWLLGSITLAWVITFMLIMYPISKKVGRLVNRRAYEKGRVSGVIVDNLINNQTVRLFGDRVYEYKYMESVLSGERQAQYNLFNWRIWSAFFRSSMVYGYIFAMLTCSLWFYTSGYMSAGLVAVGLTLSLMVANHAENLSEGIERTADFSGHITDGLSLIFQPIDVKDDPAAQPLNVPAGEIVFNKVSFAYNKNKPVFNEMELNIPAGQKVGVIGQSGSGKSTFISLLLRFYDVDQQEIMIDRQNIGQVTQDSLRQNIAVIPQDTHLFHRSLRENIRYGRLDATDEDVMAAAKKAYCHDFIMHLPEGYNTLVGERGLKLSGGQRQRIAIARAILKDAPILILDEATSALDSESEQLIQNALREAMCDKTVIAVAHRLSTVAHLDRILVFQNGQIVEDGDHNTLLAAQGTYARMWRKQSGGFLG